MAAQGASAKEVEDVAKLDRMERHHATSAAPLPRVPDGRMATESIRRNATAFKVLSRCDGALESPLQDRFPLGLF